MDDGDKKPGKKDILKNMFSGIRPFTSPFHILIVIFLSIFTVEALVMLFLTFFPEIPETALILLDPVLLLLVLSPVLYFFLFRPLLISLNETQAAQTETRRQRDLAQRYLDVAGAMIIVLNAEKKVTLINRRGCEILGYSDKEIMGKDWLENFVPKRLHREVNAALSSLLLGDTEYAGYYENPVLTKAGERVLLFHNIPLVEDGKIVGILSSGEDITERKNAEKALRESEARYRLVHNSAFEAIITSDDGDRIVDANPSAEKIFGYSRGEMIGMQITELMPEKYRARHLEAVRRFLETGIPTAQGKVLEFEGLRKNREVFPMELALGSFSIAGKINFTGTIRDITEKKRAEKERELIQMQLNQAQKMEAIGRFAGGIAHDFNNILTSIRGNAELALEDVKKGDPLYDRVDGIILTVLGASRLIRQLLLFSRRQAVEKVPLNVNKVIENLLGMVTRLIGEDITIAADFKPDIWTVQADEGNIEQVIMNLSVNARDAMPQGGKLTLKTENVRVTREEAKALGGTYAGRAVKLTVSDTGVGMDKELVQRIFEPFFTTKETGKGIGFGLAVVYSIVKQHGGLIKVDSEPGKGTTFTVYLPALEEEEKKEGTSRLDMRYEGHGEGVLLAEGEDKVREFTKVALSEHGYRVFEAKTAEEAVAVFERSNGNIKLLLSDSALPDQSGLSLAGMIRNRKGEDMPVVIACGIDYIKNHLDAKKVRFLQKPYSVKSLLKIVKNSIEQAGVNE